MGIGEILKNIATGTTKGESKKGPVQKCPNCGETVLLSMDRCPKCGVHVKSMFRRKCPKCADLNELDAKKCRKCGYDFVAELERAQRTVYVCPICGYRMDAILTQCPACNTRFL
ncbi:TPA: hypothetical protein HA238_02255 [Candidatus Micrarchaeota archaeon]|nr:hypothetical protein [Candidatus Micrarchaeota archaeon]